MDGALRLTAAYIAADYTTRAATGNEPRNRGQRRGEPVIQDLPNTGRPYVPQRRPVW